MWLGYHQLLGNLFVSRLYDVQYMTGNCAYCESVYTLRRLPYASVHDAVKTLISVSCAEHGWAILIAKISMKMLSWFNYTLAYLTWLPVASLKQHLSTNRVRFARIGWTYPSSQDFRNKFVARIQSCGVPSSGITIWEESTTSYPVPVLLA